MTNNTPQVSYNRKVLDYLIWRPPQKPWERSDQGGRQDRKCWSCAWLNTANPKGKCVARWGTSPVLCRGPILHEQARWRAAAETSGDNRWDCRLRSGKRWGSRLCPLCWPCMERKQCSSYSMDQGASPPSPPSYPALSFRCTSCSVLSLSYPPRVPIGQASTVRGAWSITLIPDPHRGFGCSPILHQNLCRNPSFPQKAHLGQVTKEGTLIRDLKEKEF